MADEQEQTSANGHMPEGVYEGTTAQRRKLLTAEGIRHAVANETSDLTKVVQSFDASEAYKEQVSLGETPTALFARTHVASEEDAKFHAVSLTLQMDVLKDDPYWCDEPWLATDDPATAVVYLESVFMLSLRRQSRMEGTMSQVGMLMDVWRRMGDEDDAGSGFLGIGRRRRRY